MARTDYVSLGPSLTPAGSRMPVGRAEPAPDDEDGLGFRVTWVAQIA